LKKVEFDLPGAAKFAAPAIMMEEIRTITMKLYGVPIDLTNVDLLKYYRPDGAKITKTLTTLLRRQLPKEEVQLRFAGYAKAVSELYTTSKTLIASWGDMSELGNGVYEGGATCYRAGAENTVCRDFLQKYRRAKLLVLYNKDNPDEPCARTIVFFAGGRNVIMTNFYWKRLEANKLYFIEALRRMLGLKKVVYKNWSNFFLPIYLNRDAVLVYDERVRLMDTEKKMPCPHCGKLVHENDFHFEEDGNFRMLGCTEKCAHKSSKTYIPCERCREDFKQGRMRGHNNKYYCVSCFYIVTESCHKCNGRYDTTKMKHTNDGSVMCQRCWDELAYCDKCGERSILRNVLEKRGDKMLCKSCINKDEYCAVCKRERTTTSLKVGTKTIGCCDVCVSLYKERMEACGRHHEATAVQASL